MASATLGELIDTFSDVTLGDKAAKLQDVLGKVYEYFLGQFALAEGKKGGQFYTPASIVKLLVEMIEPYKGRVFDPCCGSGGMFVSSEKMGLSDDEVAFYDALAMNESAKQVMEDDILRELAQILVEKVKKNISIDWTRKESVRAKLRTTVRRLLKKYGYPPDEQKIADRILKQAELLADEWVLSIILPNH